MSTGTLIFLLFVIGLPLAMMFMHRGGGAGMGCGGHGSHGGHGPASGDDRREPVDHSGHDAAHGSPVLGRPGEPAPATKKAHGCH